MTNPADIQMFSSLDERPSLAGALVTGSRAAGTKFFQLAQNLDPTKGVLGANRDALFVYCLT